MNDADDSDDDSINILDVDEIGVALRAHTGTAMTTMVSQDSCSTDDDNDGLTGSRLARRENSLTGQFCRR